MCKKLLCPVKCELSGIGKIEKWAKNNWQKSVVKKILNIIFSFKIVYSFIIGSWQHYVAKFLFYYKNRA